MDMDEVFLEIAHHEPEESEVPESETGELRIGRTERLGERA